MVELELETKWLKKRFQDYNNQSDVLPDDVISFKACLTPSLVREVFLYIGLHPDTTLI